jgi:hypothetical protein
MKARFGNKRVYAAITIIIIAVAAVVAWRIYPRQINLLTLVGVDGTQKILTASDIAQLSTFNGRAGFKTSVGSIGGVGNYTGTSLITLCDLVGGIGTSDSVQITGSDGYSMVFSYNQTKGNGFVTYDPTTAVEVSNKKSLTLVVAYQENGTNITYDGGGPLRLVVLNEEGFLTDGHYWIKWVTKIQIMSAIVDWALELRDISEVNGTRIFEYNVTRAYFEAGEAPTPHCHGVNWTDNNGNVWTGIPLWFLVGIVNNWRFDMSAGVFNDSLAKSNGYEVKVISQTGGYRIFASSSVAHNDSIIVANKLNGAVLPPLYWPLRLVGNDVSSNDMVAKITEIELVFSGS